MGIAVLHSGDSDSTGSIAGNLLGAMYGVDQIPDRLVGELELAEAIRQIAVDLHTHFGVEGFETSEEDWLRYPG